MKWKMHENSLFSVLLRNPWWVSLLIAAGTVAAARIFIPIEYALFAGLPFFVIAMLRGWRELRTPSDEAIAKRLDALRALPAEAFLAALQAGYEREGWKVTRLGGPAADLALERGGKLAVLACKRWKAVRTGVEPLRELDAAFPRKGHDRIYVAVGEITQQARAFAAEKGISLVEARDLVRVVGR